ncbi:hypothetical protein [Micromonospora rubida]|nr:hypothetical protein [Micromonospora rubida]NBE80212.1 hypothetical protein [Micromonospora rubida]
MAAKRRSAGLRFPTTETNANSGERQRGVDQISKENLGNEVDGEEAIG